jgi:two-component system OmpR family sensor kinase
MYATEIGGQHVEVAQPVDVREDQAEVAAIAALLPVLLLIPALAIVIGFVIRKLLQPVRELAQVVARRDDFAQETLPSAGLPTELKPLVEEINKLLTRQREAAERERAFIADAAHALRTPLAALQLQADVLEGSADAQERAARLADLRAGIQRAARLSTQLLSLARAESGAVGNPESVALDDALLEVNSLYGPTAKTASVALSVEGSSGVRVRTDLRRLILVFGNLLENALRYSPPGARIDVLTRREGKDVEVQVLDEGPGIPESEIVRVFERFHRPVDDDRSGSGLGLATVQSLVRQIGGEVTLHNRADRRGLCARVVLPCTNPTG